MRQSPPAQFEQYRMTAGQYGSNSTDGCNGAFMIPVSSVPPASLRIIASDGTGWPFGGIVWEHVSVSLIDRRPTWDEMDFVRSIFWRDDETVIQLHVPRDQHVNYHENCLHLWKPKKVVIPLPPRETLVPDEPRIIT